MILNEHLFTIHKMGIWKQLHWLFACCIAVIGFLFLRDYLSQSVSISMMGILAVAVYLQPAARKDDKTLLFLTCSLALCTLFVPVKTFLYFTLVLALFSWMQKRWGLEVLPALAALFLSSPAFQYAAAAFSFPIRLQLSQWVGALFQAMQKDVTVKGSSILMNGQEFSVDPACMGLHMLTVSLLFGIIIVGLLQKKKGVRLPAFVIISFLLLVLLLNIIANLLRMLLLIQFVILPDNPMHDVVGLLCLLVYVCIPAVWLAQKLVERFGALTQDGATSHLAFPAWLQGILLAIVLICAVRVRSTDTFQSFEKTYNASIPGYTLSVHSPGIIKMENKQSLSYIKFIRGFYDTEHNPTICWQGSGYVFQDVQESAFAGRNVYTAILVRNEEKLFTAWYYTNGETVTTSQWTWRSDLLRGSNPYAVVNVTAASKADLSRTIEHLLHQQQLKPLFDKL